MMSGRRERSSPSLSTLCGHPRTCSTTLRTAATSPALLERLRTGRRHTRRCTSYGPPLTAPSSLSVDEDRTANYYASTLEAGPVRAQDTPRHHDCSEIRQDRHQLHDTARHASSRRRIVWHACKSLSPWPIKGRVIRSHRRKTGQHMATHDGGLRTHTRIPPSPRYWHLPQSIPLGLGGQASSPSTLVAPLYEHHGATQYSASSTPLLDVWPRPEPG
jgi:hypothetical protein